MKLLKYNDCTIVYHPKKKNVVVDAFSRKSMGSITSIMTPIIFFLGTL
jgi:hypothetical protein